MRWRSWKLASAALAVGLMVPTLNSADAAVLAPHGATKAAIKGGMAAGSGILLAQGRGGSGFRGGGGGGGFRGGGGGGFRGAGGGGFRGGSSGFRGGSAGGFRGGTFRGGVRTGRPGFGSGRVARVPRGYYRGGRRIAGSGVYRPGVRGWRGGNWRRYWRGGRWYGPRYRFRRPGFIYFYGGWWYPYPWWSVGTTVYTAPAVVPAGRCEYWHRQCVRSWGANNSNYYGCMRYHRCD